MCWLKRDRWKASITLAGMLLLLVLMVWVPVSAVGAHEMTSGLTTSGTATVQATPTEDATVTALNKEKLQHGNDWWWNYGATILTSLISTLTLAAAGVFTVVRYFNDRRDTREKQEAEAKRLAEERKAERERRDEEQQRWLKDQEIERERRAEGRFQAAVEGLSSEREEAKIGAAILLRTFLRPGYEQFYTQTFDLAIANLRLPRTSHPTEDPDTPQPLTILSRTIIGVFKEAFWRAREVLKKQDAQFYPEFLDATGIQLDNAYLLGTDLKEAWMPRASLRKAELSGADLSGAMLSEATLSNAEIAQATLIRTNLVKATLDNAWLFRTHFSDAILEWASLIRADLREAKFNRSTLREAKLLGADLREAKLINVYLLGADLSEADLRWTNISGSDFRHANLREANFGWAQLRESNFSAANFHGADLTGADLSGAQLSEATLTEADLTGADLTGAKLEDARSLEKTNLHAVKGLTKEQLAACKAKGAIIDEESATSLPQSTVVPSPSTQKNDAQIPSAPSIPGSIPTPDTGGNRATPSQQAPES